MARGGSKILTAIIAFILGFVFTIVAEVAVIFGLVNYVMNSTLDEVFALFKFNNADANGNQYVNTDPENGGAQTVMELVNKVMSLTNTSTTSISTLETLFPALDGMTKGLYESINAYVALDWDEFEQQTFNQLPEYIKGAIMEVRPGAIAGMEDMAGGNIIIRALLLGAESQYVYVTPEDKENSVRYPVYYDEYSYKQEIGKYFRADGADGVDVYPDNLDPETWLTAAGHDNANMTIYRQYYYPVTVGGETHYIVTKNVHGEYVYNPIDENVASVTYYQPYGEGGVENNRLTGNYYFNADGVKVEVRPVTLGSIVEDPFEPLYTVPITDVVGHDPVVTEVFDGVSVGDLLGKNVVMSELIDRIKLPAIVDISPDNALLMYLGFNVSDVTANGNGAYSGIYAKDTEDETEVTILTDEEGFAEKAIDKYGNEVEGMNVNQVAELIDTIKVTALLKVNADDPIMMYLGYGVTDSLPHSGTVTVGGTAYEYHQTAIYKKDLGEGLTQDYVCYIKTADDGSVASIFYIDNGEKCAVPGSTVDELSGRISTITKDLALSDVMKVNPTTFNEDGTVKDNNNLMNFIAFSVTDVQPTATEGVYSGIYHLYNGSASEETAQYPCYINTAFSNDGTEYVTGVTSVDTAELYPKTKIDGVSAQISRLSKTLKIKDIISVDPEDKVMSKLGEYVIDDVGTAINDFMLDDFIEVSPDNAIMMYLSYEITKVEKVDEASGLNYQFTGIYQGEKVYIKASAQGEGETVKYVIDGIYADESCTVEKQIAGTKVMEVGDKVGGITEHLTLGELVHIDDSNTVMHKVKDTVISEIPTVIGELSIQELYFNDIYGEGNENPDEPITLNPTVVTAETFNSQYLYFVEENGKMVYVKKDGLARGKLDAFDTEQTYYTYGKAKGTWKFMLYKIDSETGNETEMVYSINEIGSLMSNVKHNISAATLSELVDAGILNIGENYLSSTIVGDSSGRTIGELKLSEFIDVALGLVAAGSGS